MQQRGNSNQQKSVLIPPPYALTSPLYVFHMFFEAILLRTILIGTEKSTS